MIDELRLLEQCAKAGSDTAFRKWIQTLPSCLTGRYSEYVNGDGRNPACHVRRAGKSGTAYKAPYSCVPMTHEEHDIQTRHGELEALSTYLYSGCTVDSAKEWFDRQANKYRKMWISYKKPPGYAEGSIDSITAKSSKRKGAVSV